MSFYGKMFSTLGYKALTVILGVDDELLTEEEKRRLTHLIILMEKDKELKEKIDKMISSNMKHEELVSKLVLLETDMD